MLKEVDIYLHFFKTIFNFHLKIKISITCAILHVIIWPSLLHPQAPGTKTEAKLTNKTNFKGHNPPICSDSLSFSLNT